MFLAVRLSATDVCFRFYCIRFRAYSLFWGGLRFVSGLGFCVGFDEGYFWQLSLVASRELQVTAS